MTQEKTTLLSKLKVLARLDVNRLDLDDLLSRRVVPHNEYFRWFHNIWNDYERSVAGTIWVFRELDHRDSSLGSAVADWALENSDNPWVPFGRA
jgi:hypothetical protein